ncbi:hypothetical protein ABIE26_001602 [Pedobacter africanus]|uniref:Uncharacterized protein n=1 Tax=Pedobacter africanus TaxID=151894 RepID=A0ACC6KRM7_9SPHI|nr:hypothetical protein [Pedobacter africanus]
MRKYYVNKQTQSNGDHEVHDEDCYRLPTAENRLYLGEFYTCHSAVVEAKKHYFKSNGCYYCSKSCHTS